MKGCPGKISRCAVLAALTAAGCASASSALAQPTRLTRAELAAAEHVKAYPSLASIPQVPKVRPFQAWKSAIAEIKADGVRVADQAAAVPWTLSDTSVWADRERAIAAPPPPMTTASEGDTQAFARAMRERATPPPRSR